MLADILGTAKDNVRVRVPHVGGGFGARSNAYPEFLCALFAANKIGRPVKWVADRSEAFLTDSQARSQTIKASASLDAEGHVTGLRLRSTWRHGAHLTPRSVFVIQSWMGPQITGPYTIPAAHFVCEGVFTNTAPIGSYRGIARAEAIYALERLMEAAASETGIDRVVLRKRNLIKQEDFPYATATGLKFGSADFEGNFERASNDIDLQGFEARRTEARGRNRLRGLSVAPFVLGAGGVPQ